MGCSSTVEEEGVSLSSVSVGLASDKVSVGFTSEEDSVGFSSEDDVDSRAKEEVSNTDCDDDDSIGNSTALEDSIGDSTEVSPVDSVALEEDRGPSGMVEGTSDEVEAIDDCSLDRAEDSDEAEEDCS